MLGLGGAVTAKVVATKAAESIKYEWTYYDRSGTVMGTLEATIEEAENQLGCKGSAERCADSDETSVVLHFN